MYTRLLRLILLLAAFGWGISILGVFLPWTVAAAALKGLGARTIPYDPMLDYWMRMAGGGFSIIGAIFVSILIRPDKFASMIPLMAWLSIAEGVILLVTGMRLSLPAFPFYCDTAFCLGVGIALLIVYPKAAKELPMPKQKRIKRKGD